MLLVLSLTSSGCVQAKPPTDTGSPTSPTASTTPAAPSPGQALAYDPDLKPVFASDCVFCHSGSRPSAGYSMSTYQQVVAAVRPGDASSPLVVTTQPSGSMYRYFSGDRQTKADMVRNWVVLYGAAPAR
jgi:hypothetical protein